MTADYEITGITRRRFLKDGLLVPLALAVAGGSVSTSSYDEPMPAVFICARQELLRIGAF